MVGGKDIITPSSDSGSSRTFEIAGDTISLDSVITQYRIENGRRYHAYRDGTYWAPNDEKQNENLDINHHTYLHVLDGKLYLAPISKDIKRALDLGTGTGIWAIDFADEFPNTTVLGVDLSPIQPSSVPPDCLFEVDDVSDEWVYPPDYFDFIHIRSLFGSIEDWSALYTQAYNHLKPGGYIEQFEILVDIKSDDGTVTDDGPLKKFSDLCQMYRSAGEITGQSFTVADTMKSDIEKAGLVNVVEQVFKVPLGGWAADPKLRELGMWALLSFDTGLEGYAMATLTRVMGWTVTDVRVLLAQLRAALRDRKIHSYYEIKVVYGQKPLPTA